MGSPSRGRRVLLRSVAAVVGCLSFAATAPAHADGGSIDHVQSRSGTLQVVYSLPGAGQESADLGSVSLTLDGKPLAAEAQLASGTGSVRRTTVLAIDVSNSMAGAKFAAAKRASRIFLDSVPADVRVGIVTFAGDVEVLQRPSLDRSASRALVDGLQLSQGTYLYDGVSRAVQVSGTRGPRSVLVLSDGRDTSTTPLSSATSLIKDRDVKVDVIALAQSARDESLLAPLSRAGGGAVIGAVGAQELGRVFAREAQALASQLLITAPLATGTRTEGTLAVSVDAGARSLTDSAFVTVAATKKKAPAAGVAAPTTVLAPVTAGGLAVTSRTMLAGIAALGVGLLVLLVAVLGGLGKQPESIESRIAAYTTRGAGPRKPVDQQLTVTAQAVGVAHRALQGSHGFEARLSGKLDAGGLSLKPAEWVLLHAGIALGVTALSYVLTSGSLLLTFVGLLLGILGPWLYLGRKQSKRLKAFNGQLAPTLQLLAGSLQAGLSIAQGMDTIVREGAEPVAGEFRRALVETRLGVPIEDALESMAERMMSDDFKWTVMAIRIQREVGGNLAELMLNVAATLRERDYLRRQVKSLSAEGRFSAYILLAMPPGILLYESVTNPGYLAPLISTPMGWVLLGLMGLLMGGGAFTMSRIIKLEV
jgi:tight adherence protein B